MHEQKQTYLQMIENGIAHIRAGQGDDLKTLEVMEGLIRKLREDIKEKAELNEQPN